MDRKLAAARTSRSSSTSFAGFGVYSSTMARIWSRIATSCSASFTAATMSIVNGTPTRSRSAIDRFGVSSFCAQSEICREATHPALFRVIEDMFRTIRKFKGS